MYGTQTSDNNVMNHLLFENDVKMYGTQTSSDVLIPNPLFENDVKMYGTQTIFVFLRGML